MILKMCRENSRDKKCILYFKKGIGQKNNTKWRIKTMAVDNIVLKKKKEKEPAILLPIYCLELKYNNLNKM